LSKYIYEYKQNNKSQIIDQIFEELANIYNLYGPKQVEQVFLKQKLLKMDTRNSNINSASQLGRLIKNPNIIFFTNKILKDINNSSTPKTISDLTKKISEAHKSKRKADAELKEVAAKAEEEEITGTGKKIKILYPKKGYKKDEHVYKYIT
jgi:hypothetical protein